MHFIYFISLVIFGQTKCMDGTLSYKRIDGYYLESYISQIQITTGAPGRTKCCMYCHNTPGCTSVSYNKNNGLCRLSTLTPYNGGNVKSSINWEIWYIKNDEWRMVFRAIPGNGVDVMDSWVTGSSTSSDKSGDCILPKSTTCTTHYRADLVKFWDKLNVQQVKIEVYKGTQSVAYLVFNTNGMHISQWFSRGTLVDSSWISLMYSKVMNIFSMKGFGSRHFYINRNHGGCSVDRGWLMIIDILSSYWGCTYDNAHVRPAILYALNDATCMWDAETYGVADSMFISIKM